MGGGHCSPDRCRKCSSNCRLGCHLEATMQSVMEGGGREGGRSAWSWDWTCIAVLFGAMCCNFLQRSVAKAARFFFWGGEQARHRCAMQSEWVHCQQLRTSRASVVLTDCPARPTPYLVDANGVHHSITRTSRNATCPREAPLELHLASFTAKAHSNLHIIPKRTPINAAICVLDR